MDKIARRCLEKTCSTPDSVPGAGAAAAENPDAPIQRWSTASVEPPRRLDYFAAAVSNAIFPLGMRSADPLGFEAEMEFAHLDTLAVCKVKSCPHGAFRGASELARTAEHRFTLMLALDASWTAEHRGSVRLLPGDIFLADSDCPFAAEICHRFTGLGVSVSETWLRRWLPDPAVLLARCIEGRSPWGHALASYVASLSPSLALSAPLPLAVLADQVGSLLALTASAAGALSQLYSPAVRSLHERILDCIAQRCTEPELTAAQVAASVGISIRTLHRTLAAANQTYGGQLIEARVQIAERMLGSNPFKRITIAEIGRRAGFASASHFARVMRRHTGRTPLQLRRPER